MAEGQIVLADLVILRQIGVVIVLAIPLGEGGDPAMKGQRCLEGQVESMPIHDRQYAGHADTNRASSGVGRQTECRAASAKQLGAGKQLDVHFQADDDTIRIRHLKITSPGWPEPFFTLAAANARSR